MLIDGGFLRNTELLMNPPPALGALSFTGADRPRARILRKFYMWFMAEPRGYLIGACIRQVLVIMGRGGGCDLGQKGEWRTICSSQARSWCFGSAGEVH